MKFKIYEVSIYILLLSLTCAVFISGFQITNLEKENTKLKYVISQKNIKITKLEIDQKIKINIIKNKVNDLHKFLIRLYPGYNYQSKVDNTIFNLDNDDFSKNLDKMPTDLLGAYIDNYKIKQHGVNNYQKTYKNLRWPLDEKTSFVSCKGGEFGSERPFKNRGYGYHHLGIDTKSFSSNSVYSIYDMTIYRKYYTEASGWILEVKMAYKNEEGKRQYLFARYMHLKDIDNYVKTGQFIKSGTVIATMGNTGVLSSSTHCHLELFEWNGNDYIPVNFVKNSTYGNKVIRNL